MNYRIVEYTRRGITLYYRAWYQVEFFGFKFWRKLPNPIKFTLSSRSNYKFLTDAGIHDALISKIPLKKIVTLGEMK
jgi:hypothetical protein